MGSIVWEMENQSQPNLIVILADDLGYYGGEDIKTPQMDHLTTKIENMKAEGIYKMGKSDGLTNFYKENRLVTELFV